MNSRRFFFLSPISILLCLLRTTWASIDCYNCSSRNRTNIFCEDPMSPAFLPLSKNCMVPKENHIGKFPANYCVKIVGTSLKTEEHLVIRTCVLEDMNSQCGTFRFEEDTLSGCILTCDYDGCNQAVRPHLASFTSGILFIINNLLIAFCWNGL